MPADGRAIPVGGRADENAREATGCGHVGRCRGCHGSVGFRCVAGQRSAGEARATQGHRQARKQAACGEDGEDDQDGEDRQTDQDGEDPADGEDGAQAGLDHQDDEDHHQDNPGRHQDRDKDLKITTTQGKTIKFVSGKTKVVSFTGQKGFKTKPGTFVKPAHIVHNAKHIAGLHGHHHGHKAFFFRHGGHRWHRWYYPFLAGGLWYWYWYDVPSDNDPAVVSLADTALPDCDPDEDECIELDE